MPINSAAYSFCFSFGRSSPKTEERVRIYAITLFQLQTRSTLTSPPRLSTQPPGTVYTLGQNGFDTTVSTKESMYLSSSYTHGEEKRLMPAEAVEPAPFLCLSNLPRQRYLAPTSTKVLYSHVVEALDADRDTIEVAAHTCFFMDRTCNTSSQRVNTTATLGVPYSHLATCFSPRVRPFSENSLW